MFRPPVVRPADAPVPSAPPLPPTFTAPPMMSSALASPCRPSPASIAGSCPVRSPDLSAETADPVLDLPPSSATGGPPPPAYSDGAGFPDASMSAGAAPAPSSTPGSPVENTPPPRSAFALRWFPVSLTISAALSFWLVAISATIFNVNPDTTTHYNHSYSAYFSSGSDLVFAGVFAALFFLSAMFDLTWLFSYRTLRFRVFMTRFTSQMPRARMRIFLIFTLVTALHWWLVQSALWEVAFFQLLGMGGGLDVTPSFLSPSLFMVVCLFSRMMTLTMCRQAVGRRITPN
ncbi:hypothetical protein AMAG_19296 [Allomyces macrogynus ATCC 38327]|uniref:Uncharacterized protein n=1 Tax=Allomyces macrogynus (strain ATCC 38327) TaxID=578462 RepID=A0A0L0STW4_ALLM3|nr:hypothetical protein AMAG_19296 [Allomyces macrogynus ATCC 38327]|eukprot:KNE65936.1 hypothetical protein AMAG_19296 [Allomyces macrogynus ATCC 38327]